MIAMVFPATAGSPMVLMAVLLCMAVIGSLINATASAPRQRIARAVLVALILGLLARTIFADAMVIGPPCGPVCQACRADGYPDWICLWLF